MKGLFATLSITTFSINDTKHNTTLSLYAECHILFIVMFIVVMLNVVMLNVVMPSVVAPFIVLDQDVCTDLPRNLENKIV